MKPSGRSLLDVNTEDSVVDERKREFPESGEERGAFFGTVSASIVLIRSDHH